VANVQNCPVVDLEAGHMRMVSRPDGPAAVLNEVTAA